MDEETDRHTDRQTDRHTDRRTDRQTHRQTDRQTHTHRQTDRQTDRQIVFLACAAISTCSEPDQLPEQLQILHGLHPTLKSSLLPHGER